MPGADPGPVLGGKAWCSKDSGGGVAGLLWPETGERTETLDLVLIGADGSPHWLCVWPTPEDNPRHARLELWMAVHGHQIVGKPASWFDSCEDQGD